MELYGGIDIRKENLAGCLMDKNETSTVGPIWHFTIIYIINNSPNKLSKRVGEINGKKWTKYLYTTNTTDRNGDQIYYL